MSYIPFTDEQKILANSVDLEEFLRMRGEKLERVGREHKLIYYDSSGKHDSITLRGSTWFDHKNQVGGGAIKFMQEFYDMDFQTAVQELLGRTVTPLSHSPPKAIAKEEKKEFKLPVANPNMHRVFAYLIKQRFIAPDIISYFAKQHTLMRIKSTITQSLLEQMKTAYHVRQASVQQIPTAIVSGSLVKVLTQDTALHISVKAKDSMCLRLP